MRQNDAKSRDQFWIPSNFPSLVYIHIYIYIHVKDGKSRRVQGQIPRVCVVFENSASFWRILSCFGQSFTLLLIQGHFGSSPVQIFRQSNLNSKPNFYQIPVVISKLSIYDIYIYIYIYKTILPFQHETSISKLSLFFINLKYSNMYSSLSFQPVLSR